MSFIDIECEQISQETGYDQKDPDSDNQFSNGEESKRYVDHTIRNMNIFFCLNCHDWIRDKEAVLDQGWTFLDEAEFLRNNVQKENFKHKTYPW
jgi:hypothetical protein